MNKQLNLSRDDSLHDLAVHLPDACRCSAVEVTIGAGSGPHVAALHCADCGAHRGWLSRETHNFIAETVSLCGRPTAPIVIRRGRGGGQP
jgi:hypothetical protein